MSANIDQLLQSAVEHHQAGRLPQAEAIYKQILQREPRHGVALHLLGVVAYQVGRQEAGVELIRQAIVIQPGNAEAHSNLGHILKEKGRLEEAVAAYRRVVALRPDDAGTYNHLGNTLRQMGQIEEGVAAYRQAIAVRPDLPDAYINLGNVLKERGEFEEAIAAYQKAIALKPDYAGAYNNLGNALRDIGRLDEAVAACRRATVLQPDYVEAFNNLAIALNDNGQFAEAATACRQAIALKPDFADAFNILGNALTSMGQLDEAKAAYRQAVALRPDYAAAHNNLGNALKDQGEMDGALAAYRQAIVLRPNDPQVHSSLCYSVHFHAGFNARAIAEEQRQWERKHGEALKKLIRPHLNERDPERRLRVGYVSPDFKDHCQAMFMMPLLSAHDPGRVEIFCYSDVVGGDAVTSQLQRHGAQWRNIVGQSHQAVADLIRSDRIDVLVDLTMHMGHNRLPVFAQKPAPVQVSWLAYPGSTGLSAIDYRLSDPYLDPPRMDESVYSERTLRLPNSFWCYDPLEGREIAVNSLPVLERGFITFGCLNNFCKINDGILKLWAQVMRQVPGSRLLLMAPPGSHRERTADRLGNEGIDPGRIEFVPRLAKREYLGQYHRIDLGLDSFPYNGHTTSLDSFWMGVPVVTLVGEHPVARAGWCQLSNLGLTELAGQSGEQFVRIAVELANDLPRLTELRSILRGRMQNCPLMDARRFARDIEEAYRIMWRNWCETNPEATTGSSPLQ